MSSRPLGKHAAAPWPRTCESVSEHVRHSEGRAGSLHRVQEKDQKEKAAKGKAPGSREAPLWAPMGRSRSRDRSL